MMAEINGKDKIDLILLRNDSFSHSSFAKLEICTETIWKYYGLILELSPFRFIFNFNIFYWFYGG